MRFLESWTTTPLATELIRTKTRLHGELPLPVRQAIELVCAALNEGHVCLDLRWVSERRIGEYQLLSLLEWRAVLQAFSGIGIVSIEAPEPLFKPFILDHADRFYLTRYWHYEKQLAARLLVLTQPDTKPVELADLKTILDRLFKDNGQHSAQHDWQKAAAASAVLQRLCIISGGPGTGKTTTVVRVLAVLQEMAQGKLVIRLAAPTGKAAARMSESIRARKPLLGLSEAIAQTIPETASTLHRLLGVRYASPTFRHHQHNPLPLDVLVVDEASMIDLALMSKLLDALPPHARLILLGDKDQLDSVEAGAVFGQLCALKGYSRSFADQMKAAADIELPSDSPPISPVSTSIMVLTHSFRFGTQLGIGALAEYANAGKSKEAIELLRSQHHEDIELKELPKAELNTALLQRIEHGFAPYWEAVQSNNPQAAFQVFGQFRLLAVHKEGERGVERLNERVEQRLRQRGIIQRGHSSIGSWYLGKPIMVVENDYALQLFNGDIGIALLFEGQLKVAFEGEGGTMRWISPARLPRHERAYAMTVHKSQGSEFDVVVLLLPEERSPILTRNLIYTGITRAKKKVEIWGNASVLDAAIECAPVRHSGLADALAIPLL